MPPRATHLVRLDAPLKSFKLPVVSWCPKNQQFQEYQENWHVTYGKPTLIIIHGREWYCITAFNNAQEELGRVLLPPKYLPLWRRLVYGAVLHKKLYEVWIMRTNRLQNRSLNSVEEEMIYLRNNAGVWLVQDLLCQRLVLEELMELRFDINDNEPVIQSLIEFGIRESRDWLFEDFNTAKKEGAIYLRLDPTSPKNKTEFEKGFHEGLEPLFPPDDDLWWNGEFSHFDFDLLFENIAKSVPATMANQGFQETKWHLNSRGQEPERWTQYASVGETFFSQEFLDFVVKEGRDPRDSPKEYLRHYGNAYNLQEIGVEGFHEELSLLLGDNYDKEKVDPLIRGSLEFDEFLKQLLLIEDLSEESSTEDMTVQSEKSEGQLSGHANLPGTFDDIVIDILYQFRKPNGLELPEALAQLIKIFGPGSEALTSRLLDDLALDPSGDSRVGWEEAMAVALDAIAKLKHGTRDIGMDMDNAGSHDETTTEGAAGQGIQEAIDTYMTQSSQLLA